MHQKEQLIADLSALLGPKNVLTEATALSVYECDAAPSFKAMPDVVVFADTAQQVSDIVKLANKYYTPFIARGGGTGLSGGMLSVQGGIIIALNRMARILEIDLENERAVVEPGGREPIVDTGCAKPGGTTMPPIPQANRHAR